MGFNAYSSTHQFCNFRETFFHPQYLFPDLYIKFWQRHVFSSYLSPLSSLSVLLKEVAANTQVYTFKLDLHSRHCVSDSPDFLFCLFSINTALVSGGLTHTLWRPHFLFCKHMYVMVLAHKDPV